ncbi:MAG TPA: amidohydrolase family protein [Chloroflexota bacterium]|nr:amidohydrolase family protein [Chloroflexota bacterium]
MSQFRVIDADGHCVEREDQIAEYVVYRGRPLHGIESGVGAMPMFPSLDGWYRPAGDALAAGNPTAWQRFLDDTSIETTVLYPTAGLAYGLIQDREWAIALGRAYNDWLYHEFLRRDPRFKAMALIPIHDPPTAAAELRRAVTELGLSGAVLPAATGLFKGYGHRDFDPIYAEAERLDVPLAIHGAPSKGMGFDWFDKFIQTHTLEHPVALMIQLVSMLFDGVFDRFPRLRVAFLEAGCAWVPFMMDRLDEEFERRGARWCPDLQRTPSETLTSGQIWVTCEVEERSLPYVVERLGADYIMFPSDYPHERQREQFLGDIPEFVARTDLSDAVKEKILYHNARRFYGLDR